MTDETDDILNRLPARLKEARRAQGLSLEAVANLSGVSRSMVSQIERGEYTDAIGVLNQKVRPHVDAPFFTADHQDVSPGAFHLIFQFV